MKRFVSLILSVCFLFSINTVSYAANISSRKASNPVIQSMNDKYHVDFSGMSIDGFGIFLAGFFRFILHRNLKIALVLGVICIRVKGFFFGLLFLLLLRKGIENAACRQRNQHDYPQKARCDLCDLAFLGLLRAGCRRFFCGFLSFFLGFQPVLFRLRRRFLFGGISVRIFFLHKSQQVGFVHKVHKVNGLLPLGVAVNDQIKRVARLRHQRDKLLTAAIRVTCVVIVHQRQIALRGPFLLTMSMSMWMTVPADLYQLSS